MVRKNRLFEKGAEQYLDALNAIHVFQKEAQEICTEVYRKHSEEFAAAMGLARSDCEPYVYPDKFAEFGDDPLQVGVKRRAQRSCEFWLGLQWESDDDGNAKLRVYTSLWFWYSGPASVFSIFFDRRIAVARW